MRYSIKQLMMTVALLLSTTMAWAAGEVTIIKKLNGSTSSSAGTVTQSISGGKCTLTITPADGNYITVDFISAERTISGGMAQAPRRSPGMDNNITVMAESSSADPSGVTHYTFDMPGADYDVEVVADFQKRTNISGAVVTLAETMFTYNGQEKTPAIQSVVVGGKTLSANEYAVEYSNNTNAGKGTVTITGLRTYNGTTTADFTIAKATITPSVSLQGWTYGAQANTPAVSGNTGNGTVTYTYTTKGSTTFSETVPTAAGTYTVKATIAETANYQGAEATADFTIAKATITPSVTIEGWTYGAQANTPAVSGNTGNGTVTYTYTTKGSTTFSETVPTAAGTYTVKATIAETANYQGAEATADFTIGKATITPSVSLQGWTYGAQANTPVVSGNTGNGAVTYTYATKGSTTFSETVPTAAGTYTVKATIAETANYQGAEATADFTIGKATITPSVSLQGWTYGAQANTPIVSGNTGNGAVTYTYAAKGSTTFSETVPTAAGTYTVKATIAETANYQGAEATADFTIGKATITPTVTLQGWTYNGQANTPVVSGNTGNGAVTYTYAAKGSTDYSANVPSAAGTYTVKATIAETANYQAAEATADFTIAKATITPTVTLQGWTYGAQANTPVVSGNTGNGAVTYTYATKGSTTYSETVPTAAGTYTVKATIAETANYQGAEATADFTIGKATITPTVTLQGWTYGAQANTPAMSGNTGNGTVTYTYATKGSTDYNTTVPTAAGTYTVKATIAETANYQGGEATVDFTIGKATITPSVTLQGWTYGAQAKTPAVSGNTGNGAVTYTYAAKGSTTFSETVPTAAGTYTVKATIAETANYQGAEATADFTIGKATITPTVTLQGWTYNGQANTPVVSGNTGNGAVTYTYAVKGSASYSATVPTAAGTYTVKATIAETANYQGAEATADFTIGKATITPTVTLQGWTYNGQANTPVVSGNTGNGAVTYTYAVKGSTDYSATVPTAAGTYIIKATIAETANYQGAEATADFTIGKATITPTVTLQGWTYNSQANTPVVSGNTGNGTVTYTYAVKGSTDFSATVPSAAGTYTIKATIAETANYQGAEATADFTIGKATITPTVTLQGWTYNGQANTPVVSGNTGNGAVTYTYAVKGSTTYSETVPTAAGTYTVKATIAETTNYQAAEATADFTIGKATITPTVTLQGWTYNGQANTPVVSGNTGNGAVTYTYAVKGSTTFSETVPTAAGTYTVKATIAETANYQGAEATADFTIGKATITPSVSLQGWTYGGQANTPVVSGNIGNGTVTYTYAVKGSTDFSANVPSAAGTYTVKATIAETANYQAAEATADFTIGKATITPTVTLQGWTYGAQANTPAVSGNTGNGTVTYTYATKGSTTYSETVPTAAGTYIIKATIAETANYQGAEATADFTIGKATITPTVTLQGWTYNGQANTPVVSGNTGNGTVTYTYAVKGSASYSATVPTAAGTYTIKATIAETANYQAAEATADFTIGKATITPTVTLQGWTYNSQANTPVVSGNTGNGAVTYTYAVKGSASYSATVPTAAGTYTVKATIAETANYQGAEATADFTIGKATITPTVTLQGWTYNGQANTPVVSGNTGNGAVTYTYAVKGSASYSATVPTAAGTYTVKATIAETANYQGAEATADFTIGKATITPTVTLLGWTYNGQANTPVVSGNTGNGTVTYTYAVKGSASYSATVPTAAGTYTVKATIAETANYQGAEATADFTIGKATFTPTVTLQGWAFGGDPNTPVVTGNLSNGAVTFTYKAAGATEFTATVPTAAGTHTVKATIAATDNYEAAEATTTFSIGKASFTPTVTIEGWIYGEQANAPVVTNNLGGGAVTFTYSKAGNNDFKATVPSVAGNYIVKATIAETANYQGAEATADFTIGKATFIPTVTLQGWAFGAEPNSPVVSGNISNGQVTFTYKAAGATEFIATVPTAAGTHTVKATIAETENYEAAEATATFSIGKASFTPSVTIEGWTYGEQAKAPVVTNNLGGGTVTFSYSKAGNNTFTADVPAAAGQYIVKATIAETANYQSAEATADFTIAKATPEMQLPEAQKLQRDMAGSLSYPISVSLFLNGEKLNEDFVYEFTSSNENIVRIENGNIVPMGAGNATITVTGPVNHPNLNAATGSFEVNIYQSYGLTVAGVNVTSDNRADILGDGKVKFNGKSMLVMEGALLTEGIVCLMPELTIFLKDQNSIEAAGQVIVGSDNNQKLVFTTEGNTPGRLELKNTLEGGKTIELFNTIVFEQNLTMLSGLPDEMQLTIGTPVKPITDTPDEDVVVPVPTNPDQDLDNTVVDDVLYTLGEDDYNVDDDGSLSLTTTMIEDDVENVINSYTPGTEEFAEHFSGVTFMVPAGQGKVLVTAKTGEEGVLHVRIGSQEPFVITGALDYKDFEFQYACTQATYVYIYNASNIVVEASNHRAGKKTTVTVGLSSVGVNSSGMQSSNSEGDVDSDVVVLTDDDVEYDAENATLIVHNPEVNTLTDAMFVNFPFLKYLDLRNTSITGINVSREEGPFAGLSKNTFIYMPVGNSTDEPNVIIGNICESVVLDADMAEDESFGISGSFVASIIEFNRIFKKDETTTLCLPFDICASDMEYFGHIYRVKTVGGTSVQIEEVTDGLKAHVPYLFKAATNNTQLYTSDVVEMSMPQESAAPHRAGNNAQLVGCYEPFYGEGETQVFRFMPNDDPEQISFVRIHDEDVIKPFQAYLLTDVEGDILDVTDKEPTAIEGVSSNQQSVVKYFDLQGRRIANGQNPKAKGLYIVNGQKKVIR